MQKIINVNFCFDLLQHSVLELTQEEGRNLVLKSIASTSN